MNPFPKMPLSAADLSRRGLSRKEIADALATARLRRVLTGVYVSAEVEDSINLRAAAAALVLPDHCVISDRSAAWLHGIDTFDHVEDPARLPLDVVSIRGGHATNRPDIRGGERDLTIGDVTTLSGVPVTTPLRTACDIGCLFGRLGAMAALDQFCRAHDVTSPQLRAELPRFVGRRGVVQLRELANYVVPTADSPAESWTRLSAIDAGYHSLVPQVLVELDGFGIARLDLADKALKIGLEYDGEEFHSSPEDRAHDQRRREALERAGWIIIVVRKDGFRGAELDRWLRALRCAYRERCPSRPAKRKYSRGERLESFR